MKHKHEVKIIDNKGIEKDTYHIYYLTESEKSIFKDFYTNPQYLAANFAFGVKEYQPDLTDTQTVRHIYDFVNQGFIIFKGSTDECIDWIAEDYLKRLEQGTSSNNSLFKEFDPKSKAVVQLKINFDTYKIDDSI